MDIKAVVKSNTKKSQVKGTQEIQVDLMKKAASKLAGFLLDQDRATADDKFSIKGIISNGNKSTMSFALLVNGETYGHYKSFPSKKKGFGGVGYKGWGAIKEGSDLKYFDL